MNIVDNNIKQHLMKVQPKHTKLLPPLPQKWQEEQQHHHHQQHQQQQEQQQQEQKMVLLLGRQSKLLLNNKCVSVCISEFGSTSLYVQAILTL